MYAVEFTIMISDSDNTLDWHSISISKLNTSVTNETGITVIDVVTIKWVRSDYTTKYQS